MGLLISGALASSTLKYCTSELFLEHQDCKWDVLDSNGIFLNNTIAIYHDNFDSVEIIGNISFEKL